jgi:hemoglobin
MSIHETMGGSVVITEAVEKFYAKLESDPDLAVFFEATDMIRLKTRQRMFLTAALGGPDAYEGRDMRAAHAHLPITDADFDRFLDHLTETLAELGATPARTAEVLEALAPLRREIVSALGESPGEWGSMDPPGGSG